MFYEKTVITKKLFFTLHTYIHSIKFEKHEKSFKNVTKKKADEFRPVAGDFE